MSTHITESDKKAYDALQCKNITLGEFALIRFDERIQMARISREYASIKTTKTSRFISKSLKYVENNAVPRTVVLDGANIMHCGSDDQDKREGGANSIPDVAALLAVMRYFVIRGFEVFAVISRKYSKRLATNYKEGIDELIKNNLCVTVPHTSLDDSVALEFASQINGVVLTSDQYRDHAAVDRRLQRIVRDNRLGIEWVSMGKQNHHTTETNREKDYWPAKRFIFRSENGTEMCENEVIQRLYCFPVQLQYGISKERHDLTDSEEKRQKVVSILENLIVKGLIQYKQTVEEILRTPVYVPPELAPTTNSDPDNTTVRVVPDDPQSSFIDDSYEYNSEDWEL